jgi:predicted membrane protein
LYFYNGSSTGDKITKANTVVPMSGMYFVVILFRVHGINIFPDDGLWRIVFKPADGASGIDYANFYVIGFDGILDSSRYGWLEVNFMI